FWQTATARTLDNGELELTATIYGKVKIVTEAYVRRHLQLADFDRIISLTTTKIFEQLSLMGASKSYTGENIPLFPTMIVQGPIVQEEGSTHPVESHQTPTSVSTSQPPVSQTSRGTTKQEFMVPQPISPTRSLIADEAASTSVNVRYRGATTTVTGLEKVESLETDLKQTKQIYGAAYTKLIKKVKKLEKTAKSSQARRRARIVVSNDEDDLEDPSKQGWKITKIDQDPGISLVQHDAEIKGSVAISTLSLTINTRVSTADDITMAETLVYIRKSVAKDKAVRLQAKFDEEESQRIAMVHESASSLNVEEWEDIQARVEADEELVQRLQAEEREKYTKAEQARMLAKLINQRKSEVDRAVPELAAESSERAAVEELNQESSKR
nr:hypothetical protein [Tanacetum cinerariifolium]